jgi:anti-sigma regulatory factor (Ser/Thr protein kinase)
MPSRPPVTDPLAVAVPTVQLLIPPSPVHVRTARLVAVAAARRAGVDEDAVDEIRLAVSEACSRAVALHYEDDVAASVTVELSDEDGRFVVTVRDHASPLAVPPPTGGEHLIPADLDEGLGIAVIRGLVDDVTVEATPEGTLVRMSWSRAVAALRR